MATNKQNIRKSFSKIKAVIDYPDFLDIQLQSFQDFFQLETPPEKRVQEGLYKVFHGEFPDYGFTGKFCP